MKTERREIHLAVVGAVLHHACLEMLLAGMGMGECRISVFCAGFPALQVIGGVSKDGKMHLKMENV